MKQAINRREFLSASTAVTAGLTLGARVRGAEAPPRPQASPTPAEPLVFKTKPHKAVIARPTEDDLRRLKEAGFEGVEGRSSVTPEEAPMVRAVADKLG